MDLPRLEERVRRTATNCPAFLFQAKRYTLTQDPKNYDYPLDAEYHYYGEGDWILSTEGSTGWEPVEGAEALTWAQLEEMECAFAYWTTEAVYLTKEEAEAYGEGRAYNYPDGWRVYAVAARGELRGAIVKWDEAAD